MVAIEGFEKEEEAASSPPSSNNPPRSTSSNTEEDESAAATAARGDAKQLLLLLDVNSSKRAQNWNWSPISQRNDASNSTNGGLLPSHVFLLQK
jgi:hypothetical protein